MPPCGVSSIIYSIEDVTGIVRRDVGDSHVASNEAVVSRDFLSASPPPACSEVDGRPFGGWQTDPPSRCCGSAPSLKNGTKKRVPESRPVAVLWQTVFCQATRSMPVTVESRPTRSRQL